MKQWYEELFENYANKYEEEAFTQGTIGECDFIEEEVNCLKSTKILDIGCGTGRHSIELAKRGYSVTGVDLSESLLGRAKEKAKEQDQEIDFQLGDARTLKFVQEFDLVIMLCEGAFPLMETDEMNFQILENAVKSLNSEGKLIFTTLNGLFPIFHSVKEFVNAGSEKRASSKNTFDLMTFRDHSVYETEDDSGKKMSLKCNERYYIPPEITWFLKSIGFKKIDIVGAKLGAFSRADELTTEDFEMLVIAQK